MVVVVARKEAQGSLPDLVDLVEEETEQVVTQQVLLALQIAVAVAVAVARIRVAAMVEREDLEL